MTYDMYCEGLNGVTNATLFPTWGSLHPIQQPRHLDDQRRLPLPAPNIDIVGIRASCNNHAPGIVGLQF